MPQKTTPPWRFKPCLHYLQQPKYYGGGVQSARNLKKNLLYTYPRIVSGEISKKKHKIKLTFFVHDWCPEHAAERSAAFFATDEYEIWHSKCSLCPQLRRVSALSCSDSSKQTKQIYTSGLSAMTNLITTIFLMGWEPWEFCFYTVGPPLVHIYLRYASPTKVVTSEVSPSDVPLPDSPSPASSKSNSNPNPAQEDAVRVKPLTPSCASSLVSQVAPLPKPEA